MRNVFSHVPQRHQKRLARELVAVLHAQNLATAKRNLSSFRLRFAKQFPEAVACLERGFADATSYFAFPEKHWMRIPSTNGLERLHGEIFPIVRQLLSKDEARRMSSTHSAVKCSQCSSR